MNLDQYLAEICLSVSENGGHRHFLSAAHRNLVVFKTRTSTNGPTALRSVVQRPGTIYRRSCGNRHYPSDNSTAVLTLSLLKKICLYPHVHWTKFLKIRAHTGFKIPFDTSPHWILLPPRPDKNGGKMQQLITFLLFNIKNNGQRQKCSGIKDLQKYVKIFFTPVWVIKILLL